MPQDGLFFRIVRRIFLLFGTLASLAILALCGSAAWDIWKRQHPSPLPPPYGSAPFEGTIATSYSVQLAPLESQPYSPVPAATSTTTDDALYVLNRDMAPVLPDAIPSLAINLMLIDRQSGTSKWLFKGTNHNILLRYGVREGRRDPEATVDKRPIVGLVLLVDDKATRNSIVLPDAGMALYYWRLDKSEAVKLLDAVTDTSNGQVGSDYNIVYKKGGKTISVWYSVPDFKVIRETTLPKP